MELDHSDRETEWVSTYNRIARLLPQPSIVNRANLSQARDMWQAEIKRISEVHALASERYNEFAPVFILPTETISKIFEFLAWVQPHSALSIVVICRRWRSIALETASLWATISVNGREPLDLFLERSKGFPLRVVGQVSDVDDVDRLRRLVSPAHFSRLNTIEVDLDSDGVEMLNDVFLNEDCHVPQLEVLTLSSIDSDLSLSSAFISSRTPRLREIRLSEILFPWGVGSSSLRSLIVTVDDEDDYPSFPYALDDIFKSLAAMPNLETLSISNSLPALSVDRLQFIEQRKAIHMPRLKELTLRGGIGAYWELWALLEAHPSADIKVKVHEKCPVEVLAAALSRHTRRPNCPSYVSAKLRQSYNKLHVHLTTASFHPSISLHTVVDLQRIPISHILRAIPLEGLEVLEVSGDVQRWNFDEVDHCFATATSTRRIELYGTECVSKFCSMFLQTRLLHENSWTVSHTLFAKLEEVHISGASLTNAFQSHEVTQSIGEYLGVTLKHRHEIGCGLQRLVMRGCSVKKEWVQAWENVVRKIDWDGNEKGKYWEALHVAGSDDSDTDTSDTDTSDTDTSDTDTSDTDSGNGYINVGHHNIHADNIAADDDTSSSSSSDSD